MEGDKFGFSFDYQIAIFFHMGENKWKKNTVMSLVEFTLNDMNIELANIIGESIALICYHKSTK